MEKQKILVSRLEMIISMWQDLMKDLSDEQLGLKLATLPSNTIGQQLWCLGGCRESNLRSLEADSSFAWQCSYEGATDDSETLTKYVNEMGQKLIEFISRDNQLTENQFGLVLDLLAHEFQHQGQFIRYLYGNKMPIPKSWRQFWHLEVIS